MTRSVRRSRLIQLVPPRALWKCRDFFSGCGEMRQLIEIASELQEICDSKRWRSCVIGGLAVQRWGEPRLTRDVDVSLLTGFGTESVYIEALLALYQGRVPDAAAFALRNRVLLLQKGGVGIDIALAAIPFEERVLARSTAFEFLPGVKIRTCSAEDLVVYKAFADRPRDWVDVEGILLRQQGRLDVELVFSELTPLSDAKESPEIVSKLNSLINPAR
jgi:Nucleotidyltransferase of unknown function (DUF6036)